MIGPAEHCHSVTELLRLPSPPGNFNNVERWFAYISATNNSVDTTHLGNYLYTHGNVVHWIRCCWRISMAVELHKYYFRYIVRLFG